MRWNVNDPLWRLSNLYYVKDAMTAKPVLFRPKPEQQTIIDAVYVRGLRNILVPKARQLGISTVICLIILDHILFHSGVQAAIVDLTQLDASKKLEGKIIFAFERLPTQLREAYSVEDKSSRKFSLRLKGSPLDPKSEVQAGMTVRGDTFQLLLISEWGKIQFSDAQRSEEIVTGAMPAAEQGITFIETTWKGGKGGHLWDIMDRAIKTLPEHRTDKDFGIFFFPWWGEPRYALEGDVSQIPKEVNKYLDETERVISQQMGCAHHFSHAQRLWYYKVAWAKGLFRFEEYPSLLEECFQAPIEGSIYGDMIDRLRMKGAIRPAEVDRTALVHTAWDLGSPINRVVWFFQIVGAEIRVIDLAMDNDWNTTDLVANIMAKNYPLGWHYLPHDAAATQKSGYTFEHEITRIGLHNARIVPQTVDIWIGINHLRELLPRFTFRLPSCERGIEALSCYHTRRETSGGTAVDLPVHDWSSHAADGLRTLAEAHLYGMIHASGPGTHKPAEVLTGIRDMRPQNKPRDILAEWFDGKPRRPKVIR